MEAMIIPQWLEVSLGDEFQNILESVESSFDTTGEIANIEHKSYSGFFATQNGGVSFTAHMRLEDVASAGISFNNKEVDKELDRAITQGYATARESFIENNRLQLEGLYTTEQLNNNSDEINYSYLYDKKHGELAEILSEAEMDCNSEVFFIEYRAIFYRADNSRNVTGEDEIYFYAGVNTDYDYGRDKGLMDCFEETVKVGDLTPNIVKQIVEKMVASI